MKSFKQYVEDREVQEGLRSALGQRIQPKQGPVRAGLAAAGDIAADVAGVGHLKTIGMFVWDILKYRSQKVAFDDVNKEATDHYNNLLKAGVNPKRVFHIDPSFGASLSDNALHTIMRTVLDKLDLDEQQGYTGTKVKPGVAEEAAFRFVENFMQQAKQSIQQARGDAPETYGQQVQAPRNPPPSDKKAWYKHKDQNWYWDGQSWHQGADNGKTKILRLTGGMIKKGREQIQQKQKQGGKWWWPFGGGGGAS
jgi:hypothetical protein